MQAANGQLSAQCFHNSCGGRGWQAFKHVIGKPVGDHFDPPLGRTPRAKRSKTGPDPIALLPVGNGLLDLTAAAAGRADCLLGQPGKGR